MKISPIRSEADFPGILEIINAFERVPMSLEQLKKWHEYEPPGRICRRTVALDEQDQVIGYGQVSHETFYPEHEFYLWVAVRSTQRGQGIGAALYDDALIFAQEHEALSLISEIRDDDPLAQQFASKRGFIVDRHQFESVLDIAAFDETPYAGLIPALEASGICFFSMADVQDTHEARRKLYEVNYETVLDIPGHGEKWFTFEEFEELICGSDWYNPAGQFVAADGDHWIGLGAVRLVPQEQMAYNLMTGVRQSYRGRKIAQALKIIAIRYAREHGARDFRTDNNSLNAPMLAVNRKLGYQQLPGKYYLKKG